MSNFSCLCPPHTHNLSNACIKGDWPSGKKTKRGIQQSCQVMGCKAEPRTSSLLFNIQRLKWFLNAACQEEAVSAGRLGWKACSTSYVNSHCRRYYYLMICLTEKASAIRSVLPPSVSLKLPPAGTGPMPGSVLVSENPAAPTKTKMGHCPSQPTSSGSKPAASIIHPTKLHTSQEQVLEMQKELAELKAYKANVEGMCLCASFQMF